MRRARLLAVLLALVPAVAVAADPPAEAPKKKIVVKFKADKMVLGPNLKTATLTGHVKVTVGDVSISCKKLTLAYAPGKQVASFEACGKVQLAMGDLSATADELDYDAAARSVVLRGKCKVTSKNAELSGTRIGIDLDTRRITIDEASGTIDMQGQTF